MSSTVDLWNVSELLGAEVLDNLNSVKNILNPSAWSDEHCLS